MTEPKKFTRHLKRWPDRDGDYCITDGRPGYGTWIYAHDHGDRTREVAEAVLDVLNGDAVVLPKLPEPWMEYRATAMGSALREHDPNGEACRRWVGPNAEWRSDNFFADPNRIYLIQPEERPEPPKVERVPWWEALRELRTVVDADGDTFVAAKAHHDEYSVLALWDEWSEAGVQVEGTYCPDGMVPVLVEAGEAAER